MQGHQLGLRCSTSKNKNALRCCSTGGRRGKTFRLHNSSCPSPCPETSMNHETTIPLPFHLTSRIAAELYDNIIDHLHSCKPALSTCSVVCKAWLPTCRYHLFSTVNLRPAFVEFVRSSSHAATTISPYIHHVALRGGWIREQQAEFNEVISFMLTLERVTELCLETWSWDYISAEATTSLLDVKASLSQSLKKLTMTQISFPSFNLLTQFISGFPVLEELSIYKVTWEAPEPPFSPLPSASTTVIQTSLPVPPRLQALTIFSSSNSPILCWILSGDRLQSATDHGGQTVPTLRTLVLPDIIPTESDLVSSLLRKAGPTLQHLELGFLIYNSSPPIIQDALGGIDLSYNTDLRSICMHQLILYQFPPLPASPWPSTTSSTNSPYTWLAPLFARISSPHLAEITFNIWLSMESQLDLIDWKGLSKVFTNPQFAKPHRLRFEVSGVGRDMHEVRGWIRRRLREWKWEEKLGLSVRFANN